MKSSKSSQSQQTSQTDARQVVDGGSVGISGSNSSATIAGTAAVSGTGNTINMFDGGLIESAFAYLKERDASGAQQVNAILDTSRSAIEQAVRREPEGINPNTVAILAASAVGLVLLMKGAK